MSNKKKLKGYCVSLTVKPKSNGMAAKYTAKNYRGIVLAANPTKAKELAIDLIRGCFKDYDGSSLIRPIITSDCITVKKCELFDDFLVKQPLPND